MKSLNSSLTPINFNDLMNTKAFGKFGPHKKDKTIKKSRRCNLCAEHFRPKSRFERYCRACKEENELVKYGSWLPEVDDELATQFL